MGKSLKQLLSRLNIVCLDEMEIEHVDFRIEHITSSDLFVCIERDGYHQMEDICFAKEIGAMVLAQEGGDYFYSDMQKAYGILLQCMQGDLSHSFCVIGVTGTNGKTTVSTYLYQMLKRLDKNVMLIGTNGIFLQNIWQPTINTTPSQEELAKWFAKAKDHYVEIVIMEVSSIGLDQKRIAGIEFDYMIFTNVMMDHLDYHGTMRNYQQAKYQAFSYIKDTGAAILNTDDEVLRLWSSQITNRYLEYNAHMLTVLQLHASSSSFIFNEFLIATNQIAVCNIYNLCACIVVLKDMYFTHKQITTVCKELDTVAGRFQLVHKEPFVYIDYAHTPDALFQILSFMKKQTNGKLLVVFGCGGHRDQKKRPLMGKVACSLADVVVLTEDNSRDESLDVILDGILKGCDERAIIIRNREDAIKYALSIVDNNDIIVIAGKGNERVLDKNGVELIFNDADIVLTFYKGRI